MKNNVHAVVRSVTERIVERSQVSRKNYLDFIEKQKKLGISRQALSCGNLAHGFAACSAQDKSQLQSFMKVNVGIINAFNDMLSAHQPYEVYPSIIKQACSDIGSVAQVAAGVPAMCDGVTQGQPGMEMSLLSRDVIAMSTAIGFSHHMFDAGLLLGICDKIVPGLLIGALSFGHLPMMFVPAGPMASGLPNKEKANIRQKFAQGQATREELLAAESASYHSHGTCTFYGTANSNQLVMEMMGLQLPGSSFVHPDDPMRLALTRAATQQVCRLTLNSGQYTPIGEVVSEKSVVNGLVGLIATGGSTNLTMHLVAVARAAGILIDWNDFAELSDAVPLIARVYPNGQADINHFHAAGGVAYLVKTLLDGGFLHEDVKTVAGFGLSRYTKEPQLENDKVTWVTGPEKSLDTDVLTSVEKPFQATGGLKLMSGNLGRAVMKVSAVQTAHRIVKAPAVVIDDQNELQPLFEQGALNKDCVIVVRGQGPKANGMPELHKLMPILGSLQDQGYHVALVTDGRMSGASGKVAAAIHVSPEAVDGGLIGKINNGDYVEVDGEQGCLTLHINDDELEKRSNYVLPDESHHVGMGRELFTHLRTSFSQPEQGARSFLSVSDLHS